MGGIVRKVASLIKGIDSDIKIVVGGHHPTFCSEEVMANPDIDFAVIGEGEIPLLRLIQEMKRDIPSWETVPSLCFRDNDGQILSTPPIPRLDDLDALPFPARDLVLYCDYDFYRVHPVITARGCPWKCSFCSDVRFWPGKVRRRSVESVLEELVLLKETYRKIDFVDFVDGTFTYDRKYLRELCQALIEQKLDISWRCFARYDTVDRDILKLMRKAGCSALYFGLESGSDKVLQNNNKNITVNKMVEISKIVRSSGIISINSVLLGLANEEKEDIEETIRVMKEFKTDFYDVNTFTPLAGTPYYDSLSPEERNSIDWNRVGYKSWENHFNKNLTLKEFNNYQSQAYKIANNLRKRSLVRLGFKIIFRLLAKMFKKVGKRPVRSRTSPVMVSDKRLERGTIGQRSH
jgi:anaerobic magnesium-protoporphyrin IX monomethyl ester cyclase